LHDHLAHVRHRAESIARRLGMDDRLVAAVALAAEAHDLGKADPRFQVMLHGGDTLAAEAGRLLAKSGTDPADRRARRIAWERSGLPEGFRHEDLSARLVADWLGRNGAADLDADLVVHLVAAHHGRSRPVMPPAVDPDPPAVEVAFRGATVAAGPDPGLLVDWEAPARFRRLNERYGPWGLALLEAVVRLADIACSEEGG
jgi:CRISPR-associated endonuclease/helicase Cas3